MRVIAIDPGGTAGIAFYDDGVVTGGVVKTSAEIEKLIIKYKPDIVVVENFFIRRGKPSDYHITIKQIGVIEFVCEQHDIPCILQSPSILKTLLQHVPDGVKVSHVRSAMSHLLYYLLRNEIEKSGWKCGLKVKELRI